MTPAPLKAMFWKECRENARWAVLALLALSLGLAYTWYHLYHQDYWPSFSNVWSTENLVLTIAAPIAGLALGLLQILPELRRDQWAFLVHRPASRTTLFWGKVFPGASLYLLATIVPLLGLAAWASSPSHVPAPFDLRFTLAGWAAILGGLPFYFAGLLVGLRPARWQGSRALPLLTALLCPWAASWFTDFWQVAAAVVATIAVLLLAAWGSFVSGGDYKAQTKPARFALGLTLYPAVLAVAVGALALLVGAGNALNHPGAQEWWRSSDKMDAQGRVYLASQHSDSRGHVTDTATDLSGRAVDPALWHTLNQKHELQDMQTLYGWHGGQTYTRPYQYPDRYVQSLASQISDARQSYWYYDTAARQIVGYTVTDHVPSVTGCLGPNGFARDRAQAGRFPDGCPETSGFLGLRLLRFRHALYWYDTARPAVGLLQAASGPDGIVATASTYDESQFYPDIPHGGNPFQAYLVVADGQITAYRRDAADGSQGMRRLFTTPLAFPAADFVQVAVTPDRSRFVFWYEPGRGPSHLVTLASDGRIVQLQTFPVVNSAYAAPKMRFIQAAPALLVPPVALSAVMLFGSIGHLLGWPSAAGFWNSLAGVGPVLFFSALGGLCATALGYGLSRRLGDSRRGRWAWALGTFWLGGYGILLLLALRPWPARAPCPNCGRERVVDREMCENCGAAWARPRRDGTEIFDGREESRAGV